jgi:tetratricopeptide (TPR) repeat protein
MRRRRCARFKDAIALEPVGARDDDARLDAAALVFVLAAERGDAATARRARALLGRVDVGDGRVLAGRGAGRAGARTPTRRVPPGRRAGAAHRRDAGAGRSRPAAAAGAVARAARGLRRLKEGRDALEAGRAERPCARRARRWRRRRLASSARAGVPGRGAQCRARSRARCGRRQRATEINPTLVDGWRELGDAQLEAGELKEAEAAFRRVVAMDTTYGLGYAKLAQVLLEQARTLEALEAIGEAARRGGDPFFIAAIRGDIYAEMERHPRRRKRTTRRWRSIPRITGRCTRPRSSTASRAPGRASELFQAALDTIATAATRRWSTYGDHLRRMGRIGDAVKLYRRAVAAVPGEQEWKQTLREAERELLAAPN